MTRSKKAIILLLWIAVLGGGILYPFSTLARFFSFKALFEPEVLGALKITLRYSLSALGVAFLIALPLALFFKRAPTRSIRSKIETVLHLSWVLPSFLYALIVIELFRQTRRFDPLFELYSMRTVWVAWVLIAIPFLTISFLRALRDLDPREEDMMRVLGANRWQRFIRYEFPKLSPMLRSTLLHQMWLYLTSFTLVVILGGGPPHETLEVGVYTSVRLDQLNYTRALALSLWQMLILVALRFCLSRSRHAHLEEKVGVEWLEHETAPASHFKHGISRKRWIILGMIAALVVRAMLTISGLGDAFLIGVVLSASVAVISLGYSMLVFYLGQPLLAEIGAWMSPMVLSLVWWKAYAFTFPSLLLCIMIQVILLSPWIARVFFPVLARRRVAEMNAVRTLGAGVIRAWYRVEWPRIRSQAYWMMALVFGLSLSEVSTVILFSRGDFEPLSVWIQNQMSRFQFAAAFEGTVVLVGVLMLALLLQKRRS